MSITVLTSLNFRSCHLIAAAVIMVLAASNPAKADTSEELALLERDIANSDLKQDTIAKLQGIIKAEPQNAYAHLLLSECLKQKGFLDLANSERQLAKQYNRRADQSLNYLRLKIHRGDITDAHRMLELVRKDNPNDPSVLLLDALRMDAEGKRSQAESAFRRLLALPNPPLGAATALGIYSLEKDQYLQANDLAQRDLAKSASYAAANKLKAGALTGMKQDEEAIPYWSAAFADQPFDAKIAWPLTQALVKKQVYREALKPALFSLALAKNDKELYPRVDAAKTIMQSLPWAYCQKSIADVSRLLKKSPNQAYFQCAVGVVLERMDRRADALGHYLLAVVLDGEFVPALYRCGRGMERVNKDYDQAYDFYSRAYDINPEYKMNNMARDRLAMRIVNHKNDLAWQLRDLLPNKKTKLPPMGQLPNVR